MASNRKFQKHGQFDLHPQLQFTLLDSGELKTISARLIYLEVL